MPQSARFNESGALVIFASPWNKSSQIANNCNSSSKVTRVKFPLPDLHKDLWVLLHFR